MSFDAAIDRMHSRQLATFGKPWTLRPGEANEASITAIYRGPHTERGVGGTAAQILEPRLFVTTDDWAPLSGLTGDLITGPEGAHQITDIQPTPSGHGYHLTLRSLG